MILKTGVVVKKDEMVTLDFSIEETVLSFGERCCSNGEKTTF